MGKNNKNVYRLSLFVAIAPKKIRADAMCRAKKLNPVSYDEEKFIIDPPVDRLNSLTPEGNHFHSAISYAILLGTGNGFTRPARTEWFGQGAFIWYYHVRRKTLTEVAPSERRGSSLAHKMEFDVGVDHAAYIRKA